jgi:hypothetical protein
MTPVLASVTRFAGPGANQLKNGSWAAFTPTYQRVRSLHNGGVGRGCGVGRGRVVGEGLGVGVGVSNSSLVRGSNRGDYVAFRKLERPG